MNKKIRKFVYELSENARIRTKELGKSLRISQQAASYLLKSMEKKKIILGYSLVIDSARFGYIQVLVYFNYGKFEVQKIKEINNVLKEEDNVISVESLEQGYDLAVVFCCPNLSSFNKTLMDFLQRFRRDVILAEIYPIVVKHKYPKKYLFPWKTDKERIISGDRGILEISSNGRKLLKVLRDKPREPIVGIHKKLGLDNKTITRLKKKLEKDSVVRGYSGVFDLRKLGIKRKHLLVGLRMQEGRKFLQFCLMHPNIVALTRLIGKYDLLVEIEEDSEKKDVLKDLRKEFDFQDYKLIDCDETLKEKYIPVAALE